MFKTYFVFFLIRHCLEWIPFKIKSHNPSFSLGFIYNIHLCIFYVNTKLFFDIFPNA
jgi:hypothetical protein